MDTIISGDAAVEPPEVGFNNHSAFQPVEVGGQSRLPSCQAKRVIGLH